VTAPVKIIKKYVNAVEARITASRNVMPRIYLNNTPVEEFQVNPEIKVIRGGARLMECWKRYRRNVPTTTGEPATPMHDQFSHGCDASGGMCINIANIKNDSDRAPPMRYEQHEPSVPGVM
jgi:phage terminase large subunit